MKDQDEFPDEELNAQDFDQELFEHYRIIADKGQELLRIDKFLMNRLENTSRTRIQATAQAGNILVNQKAVKPNYRVKPGDVISVVFAHPPRDREIMPENIPLNILYEDEELIVINKEAGLVVHPGYGNYTGTLVNALVYHFQHLPLYRNNQPRPGLVHRLDKNTSGVMVIAKNEVAMSHLARQFYERTSRRLYEALVWGDFDHHEGTVTGHLGRDIRERKMMAVYPDGSQGKHAVTHYRLLKSFGFVSLIECRLETGRTHQIRAHMKYIGHPLFNDALYGGDQILKGNRSSSYRQFIENCFQLIPGQALHAKCLGFKHPLSGKEMFFESPLPEGFIQLIQRWEKYRPA